MKNIRKLVPSGHSISPGGDQVVTDRSRVTTIFRYHLLSQFVPKTAQVMTNGHLRFLDENEIHPVPSYVWIFSTCISFILLLENRKRY